MARYPLDMYLDSRKSEKAARQFDFIQRIPGVPSYDVYLTDGKFLGSVKKSRSTSGTATRWKAQGENVNSDGHLTRLHAALQLIRKP
jgi:hypothetical protein